MLRVAGFVLCGGTSRRMGTDKALLPFGGVTLVQHVAAVVGEVAESVTLVGPKARYTRLGLPVIEDEQPGLGPLGGILTALTAAKGNKCVVVACDLPEITVAFLRELVRRADLLEADCVVPESAHGLEPLCAVWSPSALPVLRCAAAGGRLKMRGVVGELNASVWKVDATEAFRNLNTPDDWATHHG